MGTLAVVDPGLEVGGEEGQTILARLLPGAAIVEPARLAAALASLAYDDLVVAGGGDGRWAS